MGAAIINISSICGMEQGSCTTVLPYSAAKASVVTFTKALAKILAPTITVNAVCPGYVQTRFWDGTSKADEQSLIEETLIKRWIEPVDIAHAVLYLATADAITGAIHVVDGGVTVK